MSVDYAKYYEHFGKKFNLQNQIIATQFYNKICTYLILHHNILQLSNMNLIAPRFYFIIEILFLSVLREKK